MTTSWNTKIAHAFGHKAPLYDQFALIQAQIAKKLAGDLPPSSHPILEIGCGTGMLSLELIDKYPDSALHLTDISADMLAHLNRRDPVRNHNAMKTAPLDAEHDHIDGGAFDLITGNMVCQWFGDIKRGLKNLRGMLKENGEIYLTMPGSNSFAEWRDTLQKLDLPCALLEFEAPQGVYRREIMCQPVENARHFLHILKQTGASTGRNGQRRLSVKELNAACNAFDAAGYHVITWEILFIRQGIETI
jgi:malonyl-CoA O-methyltransferase